MRKRFAAIVTIAVVVLAMSAGPAMASVCAGAACGEAMPCETAFTSECPMNTGAVMTHADCDHPADRPAFELVTHQAAPDFGLAAAPLAVLPDPPSAATSIGAIPLADARGAPHLSTVIRT